ncbi:hypothetical protein JHW43_002593 [Diplocarpon mali]|nr:hypothetical protein JHW43_002593 [Diplocarpon mali]
MDHFNSSYHSEDMDDELYYCAPAFDPADVLCHGSDSEETPEQIAKKRMRYEKAALRIAAGHVPTLLSASLKGPFSKKSGWINPWRQKSNRKQVEEWRQPGSEDILLTRANITKMAADHGLEYLDPEAALKWCKSTAQAEWEAIIETDLKSGAMITSVERDKSDEPEEIPLKTSFSKDGDRVSRKLGHTDWEHSSRHLDLSMPNFFTEIPHTEKATVTSTRVMKRPADSEWLKGSYVSKRARWEGPAVPTPTPLPEVLGKDGRRRRKSTKTTHLGEPLSMSPSGLSTSFLNISKDASQLPLLTFQTPGQRTEYENDLGPQHKPGPAYMSSQIERIGYKSQKDNFDELQHDTQGSRTSHHGSSFRAEKTLERAWEHSFSDLKQNGSVVFTRRANQTRIGPFGKVESPNIQLSDSGSYGLPALRRNLINVSDTDVVAYADDDSFVTEVVPSSRNLEEFQFRRRARHIERPKSEVSTPLRDGESDAGFSSDWQEDKLPNSLSDSLRSDEVGIFDSESPVQRQPVSVNVPPVQRTPPESDTSAMSWDLLEVTQTSSFLRTAKNPDSKYPLNRIDSTLDTPLPTPKRITPRQRLPMAKAQLDIPHQKSQELQIIAKFAESSQNLYDISTQTLNNTPSRSLLGPGSYHSPPPGSNAVDEKAHPAVSEGGGDIADERAKIQMTLPQIRSSSGPVGIFRSRHQLGLQGCITREDLVLEGGGLQPEADKDISSADWNPSQFQAQYKKRTAEPMVFLAPAARESMPSSEIAEQDRPISPNFILTDAAAKFKTTVEPAQGMCIRSCEPRSQLQIESEHHDVPAAELEANCIIESKSGETRYEAVWERRDPQSPWMNADSDGLPTNIEQQRAQALEQEERLEEGSRAESIVSDPPSKPLETGLEQVERPLTPHGSSMTPFTDFPTPKASPDQGVVDPANASMNTQSLVEAAIKNPWMSAVRSESPREPKKIVSFGVTSGEEEEGVQQSISSRQISPDTARVALHDEDRVGDENEGEDIFQDGKAIPINAFGEHSVAATLPRVLKRILPEMRNSQLASSPALDAQAEAFIAADRELSIETEWPKTSKSVPSHDLQARSGANINAVWDEPESSLFKNPFSLSPTASGSVGNEFTGFDMDEALEAASSFLDDTWNVDVELQKARAAEQTGHRRRKLFGLA